MPAETGHQHNPIQGWLDAAGIPWRMTREELSSRWGIKHQPGGFPQAVEIDLPRPPLTGLLRPLSLQLSRDFSPGVPPGAFFAQTSFGTDARSNLAITAEELAAVLGEAEIVPHHNTLRACWRFGRSRIELLAWPDRAQARPARDDADLRRMSSCHATFTTGFRVAPSAAEIAEMRSFDLLGALPLAAELRDRFAPEENELEFIREPEGSMGIDGLLGLSRSRRSVIFHRSELFVVDAAKIVSVCVERLTPARGPGGSSLTLECRMGTSDGRSKSLLVCSASDADALNGLGAMLSNAIAKPLHLGPYVSDE